MSTMVYFEGTRLSFFFEGLFEKIPFRGMGKGGEEALVSPSLSLSLMSTARTGLERNQRTQQNGTLRFEYHTKCMICHGCNT